MWVVKLGGSLASSDRLPQWLDAIAACADVTLVPGGGPFADQVRSAQARWAFDDATAHHLALLAMEQYGRMLCALRPGLAPAATRSQIIRIADTGLTPVWMPVAMALEDTEIPRTWEMTSDSLAAWLAGRLKATALLLIKSGAPPAEDASLEALAHDGIVDPLLPGFAAALGLPIHVLATDQDDAFERLLSLAGAARSRHSDRSTALGARRTAERPPSRG